MLALLDPDADLTETLLATGRAVVQLLAWDDRDLAEMFAGTAPAPGGTFRQAEFVPTPWGPRLATARTWAGVRLEVEQSGRLVDAGDHASWSTSRSVRTTPSRCVTAAVGTSVRVRACPTGWASRPRPRLRVMVVDDHPMWRDAVERDLQEAGFDVVAVAADGHQAIARFPAARPQVVVLDLQIPGPGGVEVTADVLGRDPSARVLILSASGEQRDVLEAVKAGATGYLVKSASRQELIEAVRRVARRRHGVHAGPGRAGAGGVPADERGR